MKVIIKILKCIVGLIIGVVAGLMIAAMFIVVFSDKTFGEFFSKLISISWGDVAIATVTGIVSLFVSIPLLVVIHECGHLLAGLATGYKFVSFRIFNFTFIKENEKIKVKRFGVAGTGGQCLLTPPEKEIENIPVMWYNAGGLIANVIVLIITIASLVFSKLHPIVGEFLVILAITNAIILLMNGIPFQTGGIGNDGFNMLQLRKNKNARYGVTIQLRTNALIQRGIRPKDMPVELFVVPEDTDIKNSLEVALPIIAASRKVDEERFEEAYNDFKRLYDERGQIMELYVKEIACELCFLAMVTGRNSEAQELLDEDLIKYVEQYRKIMSSKERLLFAKALYLDNNRDAAQKIYNGLLKKKNGYLLQGEVESDLALMKGIFANYPAGQPI